MFGKILSYPAFVNPGGTLDRSTRARHDGWPRAICDYLAGMTDRYAMQQHQRIFGLHV